MAFANATSSLKNVLALPHGVCLLENRKKNTALAQQTQEEKWIGDLEQKLAEVGDDVTKQIREITRLEFKHDWSKQQLFNVIIPAYFKEEYTTAKLEANLKVFKEVGFSFSGGGLWCCKCLICD